MKSKISALNAAYAAGEINVDQYETQAKRMLSALDWQRKIKYVNLLYITLH